MRLIEKYAPYIFFAVLLLLYLPVFPQWGKDIFTNENNQHCMAIPFISLYAVYLKRGVLKEKLAAQGLRRGNPYLFIAGICTYLLGIAGGIIFFQQLSLIVLIAGSVLYLYGRAIFFELAFPLFYLVFTVPVPEAAYQAFSSPMKLFASKAAARVIRLCGIPVYQEGVNLFFPYTSIEVVDACSGMRSLVSLLAVSTVFAYFFQKKFLSRALIVCSAVPIAVFSNVVRIVLTGIIAHAFGQEYAQGVLHTVLGTAVVIVIGVALIAGVHFTLCFLQKRNAHAPS